MNQGETWEQISGDLTNGAKEGNVAFGTLTTISESKFQFGLLYAGSDDGKILVSKDGGASWQLILVIYLGIYGFQELRLRLTRKKEFMRL